MPFSVQLGLFFALLTALGSIIGFFLKHRGAIQAPPVQWRRPIASTIALFRSPIYTIGCVVATTSWGFHVLALGLAPISVVQAVIAGGLVLVTVVADRIFGHSVTPPRVDRRGADRRRAGVPGRDARGHRRRRPRRLRRPRPVRDRRRRHPRRRRAREPRRERPGARVLRRACSGRGRDITIKALSGKAEDLGVGVLVHPFALVIVVLSLVGLLVSARSLQLGPVVPVIAITSATANVVTIAAGPTVFQEPLPEDPAALLIRLAAFALVITAAAMTPPPTQLDQPRERAGEAPA